MSQATLLHRVQAGQAIEARALPTVPPEEEDTIDTSEDAVGRASSDAELAAVALARIRARRGQP